MQRKIGLAFLSIALCWLFTLYLYKESGLEYNPTQSKTYLKAYFLNFFIPSGRIALINKESDSMYPAVKNTDICIIVVNYPFDKLEAGDVQFMGTSLYKNTNDDLRGDYRKTHIGMIYQQPNWIKSMTVLENTAFPLFLVGWKRIDALFKAHQALQLVEMDNWADYIPTELSSGQQQRIALARGMVNDPDVIVADEPTGNLDFESGQQMMALLLKLNQEHKKTIIMVTHDLDYLTFSNRAVRMFDGKIAGIYDKKSMQTLFKDLHSKRQFDGQIKDK
jgi:putative ABC transport system ATP-binding protein